ADRARRRRPPATPPPPGGCGRSARNWSASRPPTPRRVRPEGAEGCPRYWRSAMSSTDNRPVDPVEADFIEAVGRSWGWVLFFGIATLILGVLVAFHPKNSVFVIAIVIGIWLLIAGVFRIVMAIADSDETGGTRWMMAILGIIAILIGVLFL